MTTRNNRKSHKRGIRVANMSTIAIKAYKNLASRTLEAKDIQDIHVPGSNLNHFSRIMSERVSREDIYDFTRGPKRIQRYDFWHHTFLKEDLSMECRTSNIPSFIDLLILGNSHPLILYSLSKSSHGL